MHELDESPYQQYIMQRCVSSIENMDVHPLRKKMSESREWIKSTQILMVLMALMILTEMVVKMMKL